MVSRGWGLVVLIGLTAFGCKLDLGFEEEASGEAPQVVADTATTAEETPVTLAVLANDTDPGEETLTVNAVSQPDHGRVVIASDQTVTYTPEANFTGEDRFTYTVSNGQSESGAEVTITVTPVDDPPTLTPLADQTINEDSSTEPLGFTIGDIDNPIDELTVTTTSGDPTLIPDANLVVDDGGADRTLTITPAANANGSAEITVSVSDGEATTSTTLTVTVKPVPDTAVVTGDTTGNVVEDTTLTAIGKLDVNDPDTGEALFQEQTIERPYGSFTLGADGAWTYTLNNDSPDVQALREGATRTDTFQTLTIDGTVTAVTLTITGRNEAPAIGSQLVTNGDFEQPSTTPGNYIFSNNVPGWTRDISSTGGFIELQNHHRGSPYQGTQLAELDSDGVTAIYQDLVTKPDASYVLSFVFSPRPEIADNQLNILWGSSSLTPTPLSASGVGHADTVWTPYSYTVTATGTLTRLRFDNLTETGDIFGSYLDVVSVTAVPDRSETPLVPDQTIPENGTSGSIFFTVEDVETDAESLTVTATSDNPGLIPNANDNLALSGSGANRTITVIPAANQTGRGTTITVAVSDGTDTTTKTFVVNVGAIGGPPTISTIADRTIDEDASTGPLDFTVGDLETPVDALTVTARSNNPALIPNADANLALGGSGANRTLTVKPADNASDDSAIITVSVSDGSDTTNTTFTVTVKPVNDAPEAQNDAYETDEDQDLTVAAAGILSNDSDIEGNALQAVLVTGPAHGAVTLNPDGSFIYKPVADYNDPDSPDSFTYQANDGRANSNVATIILTVKPVNDAPVAQNDADTTAADQVLTVNAPGVLDNDRDVDGDPLQAVLATGPTHGEVTLNRDGSFIYTPVDNCIGSDSFTYRANDGQANSNVVAVTITLTPPPDPPPYTSDADFEQGTKVNVDHYTSGQLQLDDTAKAFNFIWVAASGRGTVVKINTRTGDILGEYHSAPENRPKNPSRTTVDSNGSVWTANRDEKENNTGSAIKIGLRENNQCVDRNGNGVIDTSTGLGDIKSWPNADDRDSDGGVETAEDECILIYQRLPNAPNARHVSVDAENNLWVAGYPTDPDPPLATFHKLNGSTGAILSSFDARAIGCGGYGGLIDGNRVLWSASIHQDKLLRYDLLAGIGTCLDAPQSYGLGIDTNGNIWNTGWTTNNIYKFTPDGGLNGTFPSGGTNSRGVVVTPADNDVWVANSESDTVTRLDNAGNRLATIPVGDQPTGVAADRDGKIWVTNYDSANVMRIDPANNTVDLTVELGAGANPYNYSDMTGGTLIAPPNKGTWTVVHDTEKDPAAIKISWNGATPGDSALTVNRACSNDGSTFGPEQPMTNGVFDSVMACRYVKVNVAFERSTLDSDGNGVKDSPILYDLAISINEPPVCN